jgi:hypothetical protein
LTYSFTGPNIFLRLSFSMCWLTYQYCLVGETKACFYQQF